jgi:hypothetical protein
MSDAPVDVKKPRNKHCIIVGMGYSVIDERESNPSMKPFQKAIVDKFSVSFKYFTAASVVEYKTAERSLNGLDLTSRRGLSMKRGNSQKLSPTKSRMYCYYAFDVPEQEKTGKKYVTQMSRNCCVLILHVTVLKKFTTTDIEEKGTFVLTPSHNFFSMWDGAKIRTLVILECLSWLFLLIVSLPLLYLWQYWKGSDASNIFHSVTEGVEFFGLLFCIFVLYCLIHVMLFRICYKIVVEDLTPSQKREEIQDDDQTKANLVPDDRDYPYSTLV